MVSYLYQSPSGIPGDVTRVDESNIEPVMLVSPYPTNYGVAMKYAAGSGGAPVGVTPFASADLAAVFCGILTRQAPAISGSSSNENLYQDTPLTTQVQGLMVRGYCTVLVNDGTPARGAPVYIVSTPDGVDHPAGAFETTARGGGNVALSATIVGNVTWAADGVDSNGFGEVRIAQ